MEELKGVSEVIERGISAVVIEPLVQGVNQMRMWPKGMLRELREWTWERGIHLILDEVMTGFGRTGKMFACEHEEVVPDFLCLAKGLTGGVMPLAATLTREEIYEGFKGEGRTFYYGHSYTGNALGCAAALASLEVFETERVLAGVETKGMLLEEGLKGMNGLRRVGLIVAFEVDGSGVEFCRKLAEQGVLTRPVLNTVVVMPPLVISEEQIEFLVDVIRKVMGEWVK